MRERGALPPWAGSPRCAALALGVALAVPAPMVHAQATPGAVSPASLRGQAEQTLPTIQVEATPKREMPDITGATITATIKTTVTHLDQQPTIVGNNLEQLFVRSPGLLVSQQQTPTQVNLSYRGLGDPQESEYVLLMQDGIPLESDWIGYPTIYALPFPQSIAQVRMLRGGSSLLYGPEPEPVIDLVSKTPQPGTRRSMSTDQVIGSDGLYSTYNAIEGSHDKWTWRADAGYARSNGPRENAGYQDRQADLYLRFDAAPDSYSWLFVHAIGLDSGDPGRLTFPEWQADPNSTPTPWNRDWVDRYQIVLGNHTEFGDGWLFIGKYWWTYEDQTLRAANNALPPAPPPTSTVLEDSQWTTQGFDLRARKLWGGGNAFTLGTVLFHGNDPFREWTSADLFVRRYDRTGVPRERQRRHSNYYSVFAQGLVRLPHAFHVVASARLERERVAVTETVKPPFLSRPLIDQANTRTVPLFSLGIGNQYGHGNESYFNVSQGWRPLRYLDFASPFANSAGPAPNPQKSVTWELGSRGTPLLGLYYDLSLFWTNFRNQIETQRVNNIDVIEVNAGDSRERGFEGEIDYDFFAPTPLADDGQHLEGFASVSLLNARWTRSSIPGLEGTIPPYAPRYLAKYGLIWSTQQRTKVSLTAISSASQYWHSAAFGPAPASMPPKIPACTLIDFTADWQVTRSLKLLAGISNLADRRYYDRVFTTGTAPAFGRTWYSGVALKL